MAKQALGDVFRKGEEIFQSVSGRLLEKPAVARAFGVAMAGKSKVDEGLAVALKRMNLQTRSEFRGLKSRVDGLEMQLAELREALEAMQTSKTPAARPRARTKKAARKA